MLELKDAMLVYCDLPSKVGFKSVYFKDQESIVMPVKVDFDKLLQDLRSYNLAKVV